MKILSVSICAVVFSAFAIGAEVPTWLDSAKPLIKQVEQAKRDGVSATNATQALIENGRDPANSVQSVVRTYGQCDALRDSVSVATKLVPADTQTIIESVSALESCVCSVDTVWPTIRLESRLRIETRRDSVPLGLTSSCLAAAAQAAVLAAPEQADAVLKGAIGAGRRGGMILDSVGQVGAEPVASVAAENLKRDVDADQGCSRDLVIDDKFEKQKRWADKASSADVVAMDEKKCESTKELMLDGVITARTADNAVSLKNDTSDIVDLEKGRYALEVYFAGSKTPGRLVGLEGTINPGQTFVVASDEAADSVKAAANVVTRSVRVSPGDSVVLRRGSEIRDCRGVTTAIGMIANTLGKEQGSQWLRKTSDEYAGGGKVLRAVDSMGEVAVQARDWQGEAFGKPIDVMRTNDTCKGDVEPADTFSISGGWSSSALDPSSLAQQGHCAQRSADLVIAQYQNDADKYRAVEILNNTSGDVDLAQGGYVLEVYADAAKDPTQTIALKGVVPVGKSFFVADNKAPKVVTDISQLVTAELGVEKINALVLRRYATNSAQTCAAEVIAAARDIGPVPVQMTLLNPFVPSREARNDDPIIDPTRGGELASPN
jgi:hypothetical protein